ncbi:MAG: hypothetical protein ACFE0Q_15645 [Anaerolineae bacterium]
MDTMHTPADYNNIPFAGRDPIYARLKQQILDPSHTHALVFIGHDGIGKTSLLTHFTQIFDDPILSIFTSLQTEHYHTFEDLLHLMHDGIQALLVTHQFSLSRVPDFDHDETRSYLTWFDQHYLPEVWSVIRPHRRIVWLLDDAHHLLRLTDDERTALHALSANHPQLSLVLTLNTIYEESLPELQPLVMPVIVERIHRLSAEASSQIIKQYAPNVPADWIEQIVQASGRHPRLVARFGETLQNPPDGMTNFEALQLAVYRDSHEEFRQIWMKRSRDERLVLTAIASLIYDNPLQSVTASRIETWLVETDYLLDVVTINAVLRSLDYQDIINQQQGAGIQITTGLFQRWLLEQARLDEPITTERGQMSLRLIAIALIVALIVLALVLLVPPAYLEQTAIPTATLAT